MAFEFEKDLGVVMKKFVTYPAMAGSDTTGDDSSNTAKYIKIQG